MRFLNRHNRFQTSKTKKKINEEVKAKSQKGYLIRFTRLHKQGFYCHLKHCLYTHIQDFPGRYIDLKSKIDSIILVLVFHQANHEATH